MIKHITRKTAKKFLKLPAFRLISMLFLFSIARPPFTGRLNSALPRLAGTAPVQLFLGDSAVAVVAADLVFVHAVRVFGEQRLAFVDQHPPRRDPDVFVHGRRHRADHPAVAVAAAHLCAHRVGLRAVPEFLPGLGVQVAHDLLLPGAVAGHDVAVGVDEEGVEAHVAGQQPLLAVDIVDQAVVEVGAEPLLGAVAAQQLVDQRLEVPGHHGAVVDDVVRLDKIEAVVEGRRRKLHPHLVRDAVERHEVGRVFVLHRHPEADVLHPHGAQGFQGLVTALVAVRQAADGVVRLLQALDGDADADLRELPAQVHDPVGEKAVGGDHDAVGLFIQLPHDLLQVGADKRLAAGDVGKIHGGQLFDRFHADLILRPGGRLIAVAHGAARVAAIGHDHSTVQLFVL